MANSMRTVPSASATRCGKKNAVSLRFLRAATALRSGPGPDGSSAVLARLSAAASCGSAPAAATGPAGPGAPKPLTDGDAAKAAGTLREFKDSSERAYLVAKLRENGWNISKTAEIIDTPRSNLYKKLEQYGIKQDTDG